MSLEAALAAENSAILHKYSNTTARGRSTGNGEPTSLSTSPYSSGMRSRSRGRSSSRRRGSVFSEDTFEFQDFKWSILHHDPSKRFVNSQGSNNADNKEPEEISEEELISDDDDIVDFDINEIILPNYHASINQFYKQKTGQAFSNISNEKSKHDHRQIEKERTTREENIVKKSRELSELTEVLSLKKAVDSAKASGSTIPRDTIANVTEKLKELGIKDPERMNVDEIVELDNRKEKVYRAYKELLIHQSKYKYKNHLEPKQKNKLLKSELSINIDGLRVSRTLTLGDFFNADSVTTKAKDVDSYLIYVDLSADSLNALQYTLGAVVKSEDVLYVINSANDEKNIEYYEKQCEKITDLVTTYLNLIDDADFKLHVAIETTYHLYPRHFLNELVKYLKPNLFIVGYNLLLNPLSNYISNIPVLVVKKKTKKKPTASRIGNRA